MIMSNMYVELCRDVYHLSYPNSDWKRAPFNSTTYNNHPTKARLSTPCILVDQGAFVYRGRGLVVIATSQNLLARWPEEDCVLKLGRVRALDVTQGRVGINNAVVNQILKAHQVLGLAAMRILGVELV